MYDYFEAFSIIPYRLATNGQFATTWTKKTPMHKRTVNFVDLCSAVGIVWSTTTRTRVSDATAVTFSIKCFNPLKLYPLSGNIFRKWFASYFYLFTTI